MSEPAVTTTTAGAVREVCLNRPDQRNAVNPDLVAGIEQALREAEGDAEIGAVLLHGAGKHFCAGLDLKDPGFGSIGPIWQKLHRFIGEMETPIVIAHHGAAINAGAALVLSGDLVVSGESAFLQIMEARMGMTPPVNLAWLLYRHSRSLASRLSLTGDRVDGIELARLGVAYEAVPDGDVLDRARALATQLAEYPKHAGAGINRMIASPTPTFDDVLNQLTAK